MPHIDPSDRYGLIINPFPIAGYFPLDSEYEKTYAQIITGKKEVVERVKKFVEDIIAGDTVPVAIIVGDYGYGKTHLLKHIQYRIQEEAKNIFPIYIKNIGEPKILRLYKAILDGIRGRLEIDFLVDAARRLLKMKDKLDQIRIIFPDYAKAIKFLSNKNHTAIRWLFGEKLDNESLKSIGIIREITEDNAADALIALIRLIYYGKGYRLLILVDELESVIGVEDVKMVRKFYEGLRAIIDKTGNEAQYIFAAPPAILLGKESISKLHPALESRLSQSIIELKELDEESAKMLIREYLTKFRRSDVVNIVEPLYPFTEESIQVLHKQSKGVPRRLLMLAHAALKEATKRNLKEISSNFVSLLINNALEKSKEESDEITEAIKEVIKESEIDEEIEKQKDLTALQKEIIKALKKNNNTLALGALSTRVGCMYDDAKKVVRDLESKGIVKLVRRGRGYRVYLRIK